MQTCSSCAAGALPPSNKASQAVSRICEAKPPSSGAGGGAGPAARLEKELEKTLREFVRMRTVSSDPSLREDCFKGAKYLAHLLESLGTSACMFASHTAQVLGP